MSHTIERVVVGVSGSPGSLLALRFAVDHAYAFGAVLVPVIAWEPPGGDSAFRRYPPDLTHEWAQEAEDRLVAAFDSVPDGPPLDHPAQPHVVRGPAGRVLVATADGEHDVLVIGTGRRGILRRAMYGSVSEHCLARARCAVIVVSPDTLPDETWRTYSDARTFPGE